MTTITSRWGRMIACAAACTRHSASLRPRTSQQVVRALEGGVSVEELSEGGRPGQSRQYGYMTEARKLANTFDEPRRRRQRAELKHR
ncbi:unnamed protein product [Musa textilis]